jgi:hypothetical protein
MKTKLIISSLLVFSAFSMKSQEVTNTIPSQELNEIVVEVRNQRLGAEVSTYLE